MVYPGTTEIRRKELFKLKNNKNVKKLQLIDFELFVRNQSLYKVAGKFLLTFVQKNSKCLLENF